MPSSSPLAALQAHRCLHLTALKLYNLRNHAALSLTPLDARPVVLTGPNGVGKTNVLEAVSLLSPGRGLRRAAYGDVARRLEPGRADGPGATPPSGTTPPDGSWAVAATVMGRAGVVALGTGLVGAPSATAQAGAGGEMGRRVRVNGAPARTISELGEHLSLLWLTPAMDGLFTGPAAERRRFLDRLVQALDPGHAVLTGQFERALRQRNRRLEDATGSLMRDATLDAIEAQVAELGLALSAARRGAVLALSDVLGEGADEAFPQARIALEGEVEAWLDAMPAAEAEERYRETLGRTRPRDRAAGRTLSGPHRADLDVVHAQKGTPARHASTGEQKALLIGLTLAEARLVTERIGAVPILLLDEVAAHLDPARRARLFDALATLGTQAWMTGTEPEPFAALGERAQHFAMTAGGVARA